MIGNGIHANISTNFACTCLSPGVGDTEKVNVLLQKFWEIDTSGMVSMLRPEDKSALSVAKRSITYKQDHYEVAIYPVQTISGQ